jgi:hypothetical protein
MTRNYIEIRYESLHTDGASELLRMFQWLGVQVPLTEATEYLRRCNIDDVRSGALNSAPWELGREPEAFYRRGERGSWRSELTGLQIAIIEQLTRKEMIALGYEPVAGPRDRALARAWLNTYRFAESFAESVRRRAERIKP